MERASRCRGRSPRRRSADSLPAENPHVAREFGKLSKDDICLDIRYAAAAKAVTMPSSLPGAMSRTRLSPTIIAFAGAVSSCRRA